MANRKNTIIDRKKINEGSDITPFVICWKCDRKLSDSIPEIMKSGAQVLKKPRINGRLLITNRKQITAAMMNAMTWFLVSAETNEPIARNAPAIRKLPI